MRFWQTLAILTFVCLIQSEWVESIKRKRQAGIMIGDEAYLGSGEYGDFPDIELVVVFRVEYDKPFNPELSSSTSSAYRKEVKRVKKYLTTQIARNLGVIAEDVTLEVTSFSPGSTIADITVKIPGYFGVTNEELLKAVSDVKEGSISGSRILNIEEIVDESIEPENVVIDLGLTYQMDISDGKLNLYDRDSDDFLQEALTVQQELTLHIVAKLASQGSFISPDKIKIDILDFKSVGENTEVTLSIEAKGITIDQLSDALNYLVTDDDVGINGRLVISIEELSRSVPYEYPDYPITDEEVMMPHGEYDTGESLPPEVENEVMPTMHEEDHHGPEREPPVEPDLIPVTDTEPLPPDPEETIPPFPGEEIPDHCTSVKSPERGSVVCDQSNNIGSVCEFSCQDDSTMEGERVIICDRDGAWSADTPYCIRIFCQPHLLGLENGKISCTDHNAFESECTFTCNERHSLRGAEKLRCQYNKQWTNKQPTCEPDPINCDEEYGPWSECENGKRMKDAVMLSSFGSSVICPEIIEDCVDCQLEWGEWGECSGGVRIQVQEIVVEKVGAGKDCASPQLRKEDCQECVVEWGDWGECINEMRTRSQYIAVYPVGQGAECPPLDEIKEECIDCEVVWGEWSECANDERSRRQFVAQPRIGAGVECPELGEETEACIDCVLAWEEWSDCADGKRGRSQIVQTPPVGAGLQCGDALTEIEDCVDCELAWSEWGICADGFRSKFPVVINEPVGAGKPCPNLQPEIEECADCVLQWGPWSECINDERVRSQFIEKKAVGAGAQCEEPAVEFKECAECEVAWNDWGECSNGERSRSQYVSKEPLEPNEPCPELRTLVEACYDCELGWSDWTDCAGGKRKRFQIVVTEPVGAGQECPDLEIQSEVCFDCLMDWGDWSECQNGKRSRSQYIVVQPAGAGETCPEPRTETELCADCVVDWGQWGSCRNNERVRTEVVIAEQVGAGRPCPELRRQAEACIHCVLEWEPWSDCENKISMRGQYVLVAPVGAGNPCPELQIETEECLNCEVAWGEWGECSLNERHRFQYIVQQSVGRGTPCPVMGTESEDCIDCVIEWGEWEECSNNERKRSEYVRVHPVGIGEECRPLETQTEACVDCEVAWESWSECRDNKRSKSQYVVVEPQGAGRQCLSLETRTEPCVDCVVEWTEWTKCFQGTSTRRLRIVVDLVGAGEECPPLDTETKDCIVPDSEEGKQDLVCRFTRQVLGYHQRPQMRDLLLIGDESGSIGWINFNKIKKNFQAIAKNVRGGIGSQSTQIGMTSFARFSRTIFDFDDFDDVVDVVAAIERSYFLGGYRSNIGSALTDANSWIFQQTGGMRSFPNVEDNIEHEILIATDGCRTSDAYVLKNSLKIIKKRGIKLYVLALASKDRRCREAIDSMAEDSEDVFVVGDWDDLEDLTRRIEERACVREGRGDRLLGDDETFAEEETG